MGPHDFVKIRGKSRATHQSPKWAPFSANRGVELAELWVKIRASGPLEGGRNDTENGEYLAAIRARNIDRPGEIRGALSLSAF